MTLRQWRWLGFCRQLPPQLGLPEHRADEVRVSELRGALEAVLVAMLLLLTNMGTDSVIVRAMSGVADVGAVVRRTAVRLELHRLRTT